MNQVKETYLDHVVELRDAGRQLMRLFDRTGRQSKDVTRRNRIRRNFLETELYVLQLDELIAKLRNRPGRRKPLSSTRS